MLVLDLEVLVVNRQKYVETGNKAIANMDNHVAIYILGKWVFWEEARKNIFQGPIFPLRSTFPIFTTKNVQNMLRK